MRTFIAVNFEAETIKQIREITTFFKSKTPDSALKWVDPNKLHLTIKFIGDLPETKLEITKDIITKTVSGKPEFEITVEGLGMFPNKDKPHVVWLGIKNGQPLADLHTALDLALEKIDIKADQRKFSPHLTIARVRRSVDRKTAGEIGETLSQFKVASLGANRITEIILYESVLSPEGAKYTPLHSVPLNKV